MIFLTGGSKTHYKVLRLDKLSDSQIEELTQLINQSRNSTVFHNIELNIFISAFFSLQGFILTVQIENKIQGFVICFKKPDDKVITSPFQLSLSTYGGPVTLPDKEKLIPGMLRHLKKLTNGGYIYIKSSHHIAPAVYKIAGYKVKSIPTLLINTDRNEELIWNDIDNRIIRGINKALKKKVTIEIANEKDLIPLTEIYEEVCKRKKLHYHGFNYYSELYDSIKNGAKMTLFYARYEDQYISAMSVLEFKDFINPWFGGTKTEFVNTGAGSLIYWEILRYASLKKFRIFDFLGLDIDSIAFYKKGFGGKEFDVCHASYAPLYSRIHKRILKILK